MHCSEFDIVANLYSIVNSIECLEKAYGKGIVLDAEYMKECSKLLNICLTFKESNPVVFEKLLKDDCADCSLAIQRLSKGRPENADPTPHESPRKEKLTIFDLTGCFITLMDALMLGKIAVDEIYPYLQDICIAIEKLESDQSNSYNAFCKSKQVGTITNWLNKLSGMEASQELSATDIRQLTFDVEKCYSCFKRSLEA